MVLAGGWLLFKGDIVSGVWLGAIAWFLYTAASSSVQQVDMEARLDHVTARDVAQPVQVTVPPGISVAELVDAYMLPRGLRAVAVVDNTRLIGIVTASDVMKVPVVQRAGVAVAAIMAGRERLHTVTLDTPAVDAMELISENNVEQVPVLDGSELVGMLSRTDIFRQLELRESLKPAR
jgi:CBS domain-containing protein